MSRSSLWVITKDLKGEETFEYSNSWLFSPIVWDELLHKYMPELGLKTNFITLTMFNKEAAVKLNTLLNESNCFQDRILWELCNQQIFYSTDKKLVSEAITFFVSAYIKGKEYGDHIIERFNEIANDISEIDEPYFVLKNSSCDDAIERTFYYNKFEDEEIETTLRNTIYPEDLYFVLIKDETMEWLNLESFLKTIDEVGSNDYM